MAMVKTLLCVDDHPDRLQVLTARLEPLGYKVVMATSGPEALELLSARAVDLVVLDYYMAGMNGDIVALEIKRLRPSLPIIMFSGTFTLPEMVIAYVDGFVFSADDSDALLRKIEELLHFRQSQRAS
jgi:CheY-like chemotaxis protein